jgi:hypothetical protein
VRRTTLQVASYKPDNHKAKYSEYSSADQGIKVELLYRKVGTAKWLQAYSDKQLPSVLLNVRKGDTVPVYHV